MDTPAIASYYREIDPMKRLALLEEDIKENGETEANRLRREIWEKRYSEKSHADKNSRADGWLGLWMLLEFNKTSGSKLFGQKKAVKELRREMDKLGITALRDGNELQQKLLYKETCQLVRTYMSLCKEDRSYNTMFAGLITIKKESAIAKLKNDIYETTIALPYGLKMEEEMGFLIRASREVFDEFFPGEGGMPDPAS